MNGKGVEGSGRGVIWRHYPGIAWRDWRIARKSSVRITELRAMIWIRDLPNTKQSTNHSTTMFDRKSKI
jgi:hypothetical protein